MVNFKSPLTNWTNLPGVDAAGEYGKKLGEKLKPYVSEGTKDKIREKTSEVIEQAKSVKPPFAEESKKLVDKLWSYGDKADQFVQDHSPAYKKSVEERKAKQAEDAKKNTPGPTIELD